MTSGFFRFIAFLLFVGLLAVVGVSIYNAGVSAGITTDIGNAIASGAPVPAGYYYGPYVGHPWGGGFGFGGFLIGIFFLFIFFGLIRAAFGFGRWGGHRGSGYGGAGYGKGYRSGWQDHLGAWHDEQHGKAPEAPATEKT
jgi:hypothetical protein